MPKSKPCHSIDGGHGQELKSKSVRHFFACGVSLTVTALVLSLETISKEIGMRRCRSFVLLAVGINLLSTQLVFAENNAHVRIRAILIDTALNQKPVPRLAVSIKRLDSVTETFSVRTNFDGLAEADLPVGTYEVSTESVTFDSKQYRWQQRIELSAQGASLDFSNDNATSSAAPPPSRAGHVVDELTSQFSTLRNSVVTVWSEIGHGTGFIIDAASGLVITNEHVVSRSQMNSVQFDEDRKVRAVVLAANPDRDIAILRIATNAFDGAISAPIAAVTQGEPTVVEGERVFTIGSPLNQRKIITSGIVSKVEARAIISDININHGNSGGPLFNSLGQVVGMTTFGDLPSNGGPGIAGIVRIEEAMPLLDEARKRLNDAPPEATLLPVEPTGKFPLDAIKAAVNAEKFNMRPYTYGIGGFDVAFETPVMLYRVRRQSEVESAKGKARRNRRNVEAIQNTYDPGHDFRNWEEYVGEFRPVLLVNARPQLREGFWSAFGRGMAMSQGMYGGPANMAFQADFYRMKLMCGVKTIEPIQRSKAVIVINENNAFIRVKDATFEGLYAYPPDAIGPQCGTVTLQLFTEKTPSQAIVLSVRPETVEKIWLDFEPYRKQIEGTKH